MTCPSLSTSRSTRQLRALRNKCQALTSFTTKPTVSVTYATSSLNHDGDLPLALLRPPPRPGNIQQQKESGTTLELSRRIYAVKDCFKNIVHAAFPTENDTKPPVMTLVSICASIAGRNMPRDLDEVDAEEQLVANEIHDIYDSVPIQYRSWTLVSHALEFILSNCPPHPTLLFLLLDVCLSRYLPYHSEIAARALIDTAVAPFGSNARICHPAHSTYLSDICNLWTKSLREQQFVHVIVQSLVHSDVHADVWTGKAVAKLARDLRRHNMPAFLTLLRATLEAIATQLTPRTEDPSTRARHLAYRLYKWCRTLFAAQGASLHELHELAAFLDTAAAFKIHSSFDNNHQGLRGVVVSLATHCLSLSKGTAVDLSSILALLQDANVVTSTYTELIAHIFTDTSTSPLGAIQSRHDRLISYAELLRSRGLLHLEASLWACALHHVEHPDDDNAVYVAANLMDINGWKSQLIDLVDEAENRCFSNASFGSADCEWEWEEAFSSWVRKASSQDHENRPAKKAKREVIIKKRSSARLSDRGKISLHHRNAKTQSGRSSESIVSTITHENFGSLLSIAMSNRTVLHQNPKARTAYDEADSCTTSPSPVPRPRKRNSLPFAPMANTSRPTRSPSPAMEFEPPTSDDVLLLC